MGVSQSEKDRKLSAAEAKRLVRFEERAAALQEQGYQREDLTVGIVAANVVTLVVGIPIIVLGIVAFVLLHPGTEMFLGPVEFGIFVVSYIVLIVVHEGIHGLTWSVFAENGLADIEFGFMKKYFTPYCTCAAPLKKGPYVLGALMPLIALGLLPTAIALVIGSPLLLFIGLIMIFSAGGDVMIVAKLLTHKTKSSESHEVLYCDHPTQAGLVIFSRAVAANRPSTH